MEQKSIIKKMQRAQHICCLDISSAILTSMTIIDTHVSHEAALAVNRLKAMGEWINDFVKSNYK